MVRLVEHGDLDVAQVAVALLDEVGQPSRAGDDDVGAARRAATCGLWRGAAEDRRLRSGPSPGPAAASTAWTWLASSRVAPAPGRAGGRPWCGRRPVAATSGSENASVLPEPVRPRPRMSRPASASGSVAAWIGKGVVMPAVGKRATSGAGTPRDAKLTAQPRLDAVRRPRWAALEFSMGRTVKGKSFGLGWPHCLGPPRPWKPVRSPSDTTGAPIRQRLAVCTLTVLHVPDRGLVTERLRRPGGGPAVARRSSPASTLGPGYGCDWCG